jgi:hypothetical protein
VAPSSQGLSFSFARQLSEDGDLSSAGSTAQVPAQRMQQTNEGLWQSLGLTASWAEGQVAVLGALTLP